ncbi:MAG TPA: WG repeat-containing protein [Bacteroidia bacterium]|nr:WG repeat-containing protein [Bacteroidia bacterium]
MKKLLITGACLLILHHAVQSQTYITQVKPAGSKEWGYANSKGEMVIAPQYAKCYRFSPEGLATIYDQKERQYHFINLKNERLPVEVTGFKLRDGLGFDVEGFKSGLAMIKVGEKWGYINTSGKLAIPAKYDDAIDFNDGFASAKSGNKFFVLNTKGEEIPVEGDVTDIKNFSEGLAPFRTAGKKFGFIGTNGKITLLAQYESVGYFSDGLAWAKEGDLLGYINPKGEWVIKPQFGAGKDFDKESGMARVKNGEKWAYVNKSGELMYMNDTDVWGDFSEGLADGRKNDKKGFFNNKGQWAIQPQFDGVRDFKNGFAAAKMGDKWGVIDKEGKWIIQPTYDGIKDMEKVD